MSSPCSGIVAPAHLNLRVVHWAPAPVWSCLTNNVLWAPELSVWDEPISPICALLESLQQYLHMCIFIHISEDFPSRDFLESESVGQRVRRSWCWWLAFCQSSPGTDFCAETAWSQSLVPAPTPAPCLPPLLPKAEYFQTALGIRAS